MTTLISKSLKAIEGFEHCIEHGQMKKNLPLACATTNYCIIKINSPTEAKKTVNTAAIVAILKIAQSRIKFLQPDGSKIEIPVDPLKEDQPYIGFMVAIPIVKIPINDKACFSSETEEEGIRFYWNSQIHDIDSIKIFLKTMKGTIASISVEITKDEFGWEVNYRKKIV